MIDNRPLSPHLSIHKKILTSVFSIFHRFTGIALSIGTILIVLWISIIAFSQSFYNFLQTLNDFFIFKVFLFLWTVSIFYHLFNGIRYLFWTFGVGMNLRTVYFSSYIVIFLTLVSTLLVWSFSL
tara:strand:- start:708 stop:1082 length:375 start_codon:yes stop_codon:yes gene_type:complete